MTVRILIGDVFDKLAELPDESVDCCVTSPPYWALRDYGVSGQIGLEPTLGEHLDVMVRVFGEVRRVLKKRGTCWLNYGDTYAAKPNGRSAAATKAAGNDDRTFRDKPMDTTGAIYDPNYAKKVRGVFKGTIIGATGHGARKVEHAGRVVAGGLLKPKDLCMIPNRLAIALQDAGWWVRSEIIWAKPNPMPDSAGRYRPSTAHEKIFMLTKSATSYYDAEAVAQDVSGGTHARVARGGNGSARANGGTRADRPMKAVSNKSLGVDRGKRDDFGKMPSSVRRSRDTEAGARPPNSRPQNLSKFEAEMGREYDSRYLRNYERAPLEVWEIGSRAFRDAHFATFPPELAERCILAGCPMGGVVLDPFGGAGTTGLVADRLQREAVLIELNPAYAEMARKRIDSEAGRLYGEMVKADENLEMFPEVRAS